MTPDTITFTAVGQTIQLAAEVRDQIGRPMEDVLVSWSSGDTLVATVDSAGLVTAVGAGEATITANAGDATGTAVATVMQSVASVTVLPAADTIALGDTLRLAAEAFDENGHRVHDAPFVWATSDDAIVRVDETGLVTGVGEGRATVTARTGESSATSEITVENPDRAALVALYEATDGPSWIHSDNWLTDAPLAEWYGVEGDAGGRVVRLRLERNRMSGQLPPELGDLSELRHLSLRGNRLTGPIPMELGGLTQLVSLNLGRNGFTGEIPRSLGKLAKLEALWIYSTRALRARSRQSWVF